MKRFIKIMSLFIAVLMLVTTLPMASISAGGDESELTLGTPYEAWIGVDGEKVKFVPEADGWYCFYTDTNDCDTYATLYNSDWDEIYSDDDGGEVYNFFIKQKLYAGYTYYLDIKAYLEDYETAKFNLYVEETIGAEGAVITKEPDCTTVIEGFEYDTMSYDGLEVEFTLSDGTKVSWTYDENCDINGSEVEFWADHDGAGHYFVDVICDEAFDRFFFETVENPVESIEYSGDGVVYYENTHGYYDSDFGQFYYDFDLPENAEITVNYKDATSETVVPGEKILGTYVGFYDNQINVPWVVGGDNCVTVDLLGATTKIPVTILACPFVNVTVDTTPVREYIYGDVLLGEMDNDKYLFTPNDLTGLSFTVEYTDGTKKTYTDADIDTDEGVIDGYMYEICVVECTKAGTYETVINYKGYDIKYDINVVESPVASIEVTKEPDKKDYEHLYYPFLYGMEILVTYKDGTSETVVLSEENVEYLLLGELVYAVPVGEDILYIFDKGDIETDFYYSVLSCLGTSIEYRGTEYSYTREIDEIKIEQITENGDGTVINVEYANGDVDILTFNTVGFYDYGEGYYEGYAMTENGILYYDMYPDYKDGEFLGYYFYTLGTNVFTDKATAPEPENPTEPPTEEPTAPEKPTEPPTENPTEPDVKPLLGDADEDGKVNVKDATAIQKHIAGLIVLSMGGYMLGDVDANNNLNIKDATAIQKHIAGINTGYDIGKEI